MSAKAILSASVSAAPAVYVEDVFSTFLYTGNSSTQTITNGIDLSGEGGLVWIKNRGLSSNNFLFDTLRGAGNYLRSNQSSAEGNFSPLFSSFNANGFSLNGSSSDLNSSSYTYASWTFRKAEKFFDVVTWTGNDTPRTIPHSLGSVPGCIIVKCVTSVGDWVVYHRSLANTSALYLNATSSVDTLLSVWNSTSPTSTEFSLGGSGQVNGSGGRTYVAYLFAHDAGGFGDAGTDNVVSCGSFTKTASWPDSTPVVLGWEPQFLLYKRSDSGAENWNIGDIMRGDGNVSGTGAGLSPNLSNAETTTLQFSATPTGFTIGNATSIGGTYIYIAIRRGPMKTPTVGTEVFNTIARTGTDTTVSVTGAGFTPDLVFAHSRPGGYETPAYDRLRGNAKLLYYATSAESTSNVGFSSFNMDGMNLIYGASYDINGSGVTYANWLFRRAPGFFDVVAYTGTGVSRTVSHNLGVVPELMIVKRRSSADGWAVYSSATGGTKVLFLHTTLAAITYSFNWNNTNPTSSVFTVGISTDVNESGATYVAYLFATAPGVSKVGSYTGTGTTLSVDCGFTAGARFVLIKRTDSTGDWYVWDTARGIISGNDPYLLLNSTAAEVTGTDYIDPLSSGFEISSTAPAAINANGGSFIFLAIS